MNVLNPTFIAPHVFEYIMQLCQTHLKRNYFVDLYYTSQTIERSFQNWSTEKTLEFWLVVTDSTVQLSRCVYDFQTRSRHHYLTNHKMCKCFKISVSLSDGGWELNGQELSPQSGQAI